MNSSLAAWRDLEPAGIDEQTSDNMKRKKKQKKKYFTAAEANAMLPLVRSIIADITALAGQMQERYEPLWKIQQGGGSVDHAHREELKNLEQELVRDQEKMQEYIDELGKLGVELKDIHVGLVDFPCWMEDREVNLCWRMDEPEIAHWHEVDAGFSGRQPLKDCSLEVTKSANE